MSWLGQQIKQLIRRWRGQPESPNRTKSIQQLAREIPDEVAEAMSSRLKLDAERHRHRNEAE